MSKAPRKQSESDIYHVFNRGVSHCIIFEDDEDRRMFLKLLSSATAEFNARLHAWCLMDNHVHLLIEEPLEELSNLMRRLNSGYALYFNLTHGRSGHLFQGRFHSEPVDSDAYLMTVIRYIHQNPVKVHMAVNCVYPWSSYNEYASGNPPAGADKILDIFGGVESFISFHDVPGQESCLDISQRKPRVDDARARAIAENAFGSTGLESLKSLPREERNQALALLKAEGLTTRQIQRLTGISLGIISNA